MPTPCLEIVVNESCMDLEHHSSKYLSGTARVGVMTQNQVQICKSYFRKCFLIKHESPTGSDIAGSLPPLPQGKG